MTFSPRDQAALLELAAGVFSEAGVEADEVAPLLETLLNSERFRPAFVQFLAALRGIYRVSCEG
ncbi:MAG: hypothetical protein U1C49_00210 [Candidatus Andersenbacteria bacterium]|nr:hypothetical protein [bacterium]MDZ4225248.1 hypothetical protein [Candidatus Andersenbacteria bacterium]